LWLDFVPAICSTGAVVTFLPRPRSWLTARALARCAFSSAIDVHIGMWPAGDAEPGRGGRVPQPPVIEFFVGYLALQVPMSSK
jgi:hypothetical protein